ncbi:imidazoleglycerol-phosphate dehydratase HisB [Balneolales bacterium ANBcel1]|nr:imidazoleglycerol-phosphate dehydratase HisB [Balneolales bacterium ANBcel1]
MPSKLLLHVHPDALAPDRDNLYMRSESLSALKKLSVNGIRLAGNPAEYGKNAAILIAQEDILFGDTPDSDPQISALPALHVRCDSTGSLVLSAEDKPDRTFPGWPELAGHLMLGHRSASHVRKTGETDISVVINLDGTGIADIQTGISFYDHMLEQISRHGYMDLSIRCNGDLHIDEHHTIEDTAITLGEAIGLALENKRGIGRYGFVVAMDETRSLVALDLSGRPWCVFEGAFRREKVGDFPTEMTSHFFHSLAMSLKATLHVSVKGENDHHQIEACFKALARSLRQAVDRNENYLDILPSSKGLL